MNPSAASTTKITLSILLSLCLGLSACGGGSASSTSNSVTPPAGNNNNGGGATATVTGIKLPGQVSAVTAN